MKKYIALLLTMAMLMPYVATPMRAFAEEPENIATAQPDESEYLWHSGLNKDVSPFDLIDSESTKAHEVSSESSSEESKKTVNGDSTTNQKKSEETKKSLPAISRGIEGEFEYEIIEPDTDEEEQEEQEQQESSAYYFVTITGYNGSNSSPIVPEKIAGVNVERIDPYAFDSNSALREITLPDTIKEIGYNAFSNCEFLEKVILPDSVERIGSYAFENCTSLYSINYPAKLNDVGAGIFEGDESLVAFTIPENVTIVPGSLLSGSSIESVELPSTIIEIGSYAFYNCYDLKTINLPEGLKTIGYEAFSGCSSLEKIILPDSVEKIGDSAFANCTSLSSINYPLNLKEVGSDVFYGATSLTRIVIPEGVKIVPEYFLRNSGIENVELPSTITEIGSYAFCNCYNLKTINLPKGLKTIGYDAFSECSSLETINLPEGLKTIGYEAFSGCSSLEKIILPDSVEKIEGYVFANCTSLSNINYPLNLKEVGSDVFDGATSLTKIVIPEGVTTVPENLFSGSSIESVELPSTIIEIGSYAFCNCYDLKTMNLPEGLKTIGYCAFSGCSSLEKVILPDSVEKIGDSAFANCTSLSSINYPLNLKESGSDVFYEATSLTKIVIPEGVKIVPEYFLRNSGIENVELPSTITEIGSYAFCNCYNLKTINLPEGLKTICYEAFSGCSSLEKIILPDSVEKIEGYVFANCTSLSSINYPLNLKEVGSDVFDGATLLTKIVIPEGVTIVPGPFLSNSGIENIELPSTIIEIGSYAFCNCSSLKKIDLPDGLKTIGYGAFENCLSLKEIIIPDTVSKIESCAFENCTSLPKFRLPTKLETVGDSILAGCDSLVDIEIPEGIKRLPDNVFSGLKVIDRITLPDTIEEIGDGTFRDCTGLTYIGLPKNLKTIGECAFSNCVSLIRVELPDSVTKIGYSAFENCKNLMQINFPLSLKECGYGIFSECEKLTHVVVPEGVESIPDNTYSRASSLVEVSLPSTLKTIGASAFSDCTSLESIVIPESASNIDEYAFNGCDNITLLLPNYTKSLPKYIEKGINFKITKDDKQTETTYLNTNGCLYNTSFSSDVNGGSISVTLRYSINNTKYYSLEIKSLKIRIPDNCELYEKSLYYNGEFCNDFESYDRFVEIPVKSATGTVTFSLSKEEAGSIVSYALFNYGYGSDDYEVIGIINADIPTLSINCSSVTDSSEITVNGIASSLADVTIYINEKQAAVASANILGEYSASLVLPDLQDGNVYKLRATTAIDENKQLEAVTAVKYSTRTPVLTSFVMIYGGEEFDLQNPEKINITFTPSVPFRFEVKFTNVEKVREVYVTSDRNNITKRMRAEYDETIAAFVAEGFFDENDTSYVPGKMNVYYTEEGSMLDFADNLALDSDTYNKLFEGATAEVVTDTEEKSEVVISFPDGSQTTVSQEIVSPEQAAHDIEGLSDYIELNVTDPSELADTLESYAKGSYSIDGNYVYYQEISNNGSVKIWTFDTVSGVINQALVDEGKDYILGKVIGEWGIGGIVGSADLGGFIFSTVYGTFNNVNDYMNMMSNIDDTRQSIKNSNLPEAEKQARYDMLDSYESQTKAVLLLKTCLTFINAAVDLSGMGFTPYGIAIKAATFILGGIMIGLMQYKMEQDLKYLRGNNRNSVINWAIDPSGYVYEAVTTNRLRGVKTTVYFTPFDDESGQTDKPDTTAGVLWNASEYGQQNPIYTDADGRYAWDVPEGWWQVCFELDGYTTAYSDWVAVPPPQTNVHIGLVSKAAPKVESVETSDNAVAVEFDRYIDPSSANNITLTDMNGNNVNYTIDYNRNETAADGTVYAKKFTLSFDNVYGTLILSIPDTVKSYSGTGSEPFKTDLIYRSADEYTDSESDSDTGSDEYIDTDSNSGSDTDDMDSNIDTDTDDTDNNIDTDTDNTDSNIDSDTDDVDSNNDTDTDDTDTPVVPEPLVNLGDVDGDGKVTTRDSMLVQRYAIKLATLTDEQLKAADVDKNGKVNAKDALYILRCSINLAVLPIEN